MKTKLFSLLLGAVMMGSSSAQAQLVWRVSVKFILGASGQMPAGGGGYGASSVALTNSTIVTTNIAYANILLGGHGRGYQFQLTEVLTVSGWSGFFNLDARSGGNKAALEAVATSNATTRAQFFWRDNAINVYINNTSSGYCSFPGDGHVIFVGATAYDTLIYHEIGHYLNLAHTHDTEQFLNSNGTACGSGCACAQRLGGNDGIADTLLDNECWSRAEIAAGNPGASNFQIDNTWFNIMSYHIPQNRLTSDQLDRVTDASNTPRINVANGRTRFVDRNNAGGQNGSSTAPWRTVASGVSAANNGDIVLLRSGNYNEPATYTKPVTFRATRGNATIGVP